MNSHFSDAAGAGLLIISIFLLFGIALFICWIASLVDAIGSEFKNPSNKTTWILLLIFLAPLATILYMFMANSQKVTKWERKKEITIETVKQSYKNDNDNWG